MQFTDGIRPARTRDTDAQARISVVLALSLTTLFLGVLYWLARAGFSNPVGPIIRAVTLSWWLIAAPVGLRMIITGFADRRAWFSTESFLALFVLGITSGAGWIAPRIGLNVFPAFEILAVILVGWFARLWITQGHRHAGWLVAGVLGFSGWAAGVEWSNGFLNPLYIENLILHGGTIHIDTLYLASVANMVQVHGIPSTGWDGVPFIAYHFGSNWFFAQMANLTSMNVLGFYQLGVPLLIVPLFFRGVLAFANDVRLHRTAEDAPSAATVTMFLLVAAAAIGVLPPAALNAAGVWSVGPILSESYVVAVAIALPLIASVVCGWRSQSNGYAVYLALIVPLVVAASGVVKISQMLLLLGLGSWFFLRMRAYRRPSAVIALLLSFAIGLMTYKYVVWPGRNGGMIPLNFMRQFLPVEGWPYFVFVHFFWTWVFVALRLWTARFASVGEAWGALRSHKLPDVEAAIIVFLMGLLPGNLFEISSDSYYFSDFQRWFSVAFLCADAALIVGIAARLFAKRGESLRSWRPSQLGFAVIAAPLVLSLAWVPLVWTGHFIRLNLQTRRELQALAHTNPAVGMASSLKTAVKQTLRAHPMRAVSEFNRQQLDPLSDRTRFASALRLSERYGVITALESVGRLPWDERKASVLWIPPSVTAFWSGIPYPDYCPFSVMVGPAVAGTALLDGVPAGCKLPRYYGMEAYRERSAWALPDNATDAQLCEKARAKGFNRVLRLVPGTSPLGVRRIVCGSVPSPQAG